MQVTLATKRPAAAARLPDGTVRPYLFYGFAVACVGGPLALAVLFGPGTVGGVLPSAGWGGLLAAAVFTFPLGCWLRYSRTVASPGGLTAFVEAAAGRRVALAQALVWGFSYFLYLIYTITFVVYDLLPTTFRLSHTTLGWLEAALTTGLVLLFLLPTNGLLGVVALFAVAQVAAIGWISWLALFHLGSPGPQFAAPAALPAFARQSVNLSLLYVCGGLPVFLGGELPGGGRTVRRGLVAGWAVAAVGSTLALAAIAGWGERIATSAVPGVSLAQVLGGRSAAMVLGAAVVASVLGVEVAEFVALTRLAHYLTGRPRRRVVAWVTAAFAVASLVNLLGPQRVYADLIRPSLVALWLSQIFVFLVYPRFARRQQPRTRRPVAVGVGAAGAALMSYGLYLAIAQPAT